LYQPEKRGSQRSLKGISILFRMREISKKNTTFWKYCFNLKEKNTRTK
jgi:hypothetical protein